jgi:hypothetical protein
VNERTRLYHYQLQLILHYPGIDALSPPLIIPALSHPAQFYAVTVSLDDSGNKRNLTEQNLDLPNHLGN